ncbi:hypothetical protein [Nocardia sp. NPDC051570]|uniref:hypothetical protein n=1 Tax=Nocardia sp. NPDC051570 TaxID=3364324 RepID=UPI00378F9AE9
MAALITRIAMQASIALLDMDFKSRRRDHGRMLALLIVGVYITVTAATLRDYLPAAGERRVFRRASLAVRHSLTDWGAAHEPMGPVAETGPLGEKSTLS